MVPSASGEGQVVMNGMSNSRRNSPYANAGIVVTVNTEDLAPFGYSGPLAGLRFQEQLEKLSFLAGGSCQHAPAQRLTDFLNDRISDSLPKSSYHPGLESYPLGQIFPDFITRRLKEGFKAFDKKMTGFLTREAVITAVESRTSSPLRIPRLHEERCHPAIGNLYPCGEGSGYAGGIASSAIDGINTAGRIAETLA
jgi:hypothetical protein